LFYDEPSAGLDPVTSAQVDRLIIKLSLSLAERHERMAKNKARVIARLAYPVGVFHIAALIMPITSMIDFDAGFAWSLNDYLSKAGLLLIPTWIVFAILIFLNKTDSPLLPKLLRCIPFLRGYSKSQALSDFSLALATFIETGVLIRSAWYGAARICKDPSIQKATQSLMPVFERGESPEAYLSRLKCFPEYFTAFYKSGAESGKLDETMHRAAKQFQVEANQKMSIAISVYPSIVFAMVAGVIIYTIFQIFGDYIQMIYDLSA
ncbi:MAG: type II secretion system F family protein, partial [Verrucomicrobiota bacterium]